MKTALVLVIGGVGAVAVLAVANSAAQKRRPPSSTPGGVRLPDADTLRLLNPPKLPDPAEDRWEQFLHSSRWKGPPLEPADTTSETGQRPLTPFEESILGAYFDPRVLESVTVYAGKRPEWVAPTFVPPPNLWAATAGRVRPDGSVDAGIWFPRKQELWRRWWLGVLAHETTHAAQALMGSTPEQYAEAQKRYGYVQSPIERQARWIQQRVLDGLDQMASAPES